MDNMVRRSNRVTTNRGTRYIFPLATSSTLLEGLWRTGFQPPAKVGRGLPG